MILPDLVVVTPGGTYGHGAGIAIAVSSGWFCFVISWMLLCKYFRGGFDISSVSAILGFIVSFNFK